MRAVVLLAALFLAPLAAAFTVDGDRTSEVDAQAGSTVETHFDITADDAGSLYAKLLPTSGNSVNDGSGPNASGWRVGFALVRADGTRVDLGERTTSATTDLVPVAAGEALTFVVNVTAPATAAQGGAEQHVYVALAQRAASSSDGSSGGTLDEARAFTLVLRFPDALAAVPGDAAPSDAASGAVASPSTPHGSLATTWAIVGGALLVVALVVAGVLVLVARRKASAKQPVEQTIMTDEAPAPKEELKR